MDIEPEKAMDQMIFAVSLTSSAAGGRRNVMTASRMACVSMKPMLIAIAVKLTCYTHDLIKEAGEFVINLASREQADLAAKLGDTSGRDGDKFSRFNIETMQGTKVNAPLIVGAAASMECKVVNSVVAGQYTIFIGEVVAVHVSPNAQPLVRYRHEFWELGGRV